MNDALAHAGPWTIDDLVDTPDDGQRYEILEGSLIVSPAPGVKHQAIAARLAATVREQAPAAYEVLEGVGIRFTDGSMLIPDVVVLHKTSIGDVTTISPGDVVVAIEIESPSSVTMDRVAKPARYSSAGIGHYWRVGYGNSGQVEVSAHNLRADVYSLAAPPTGGRLTLDTPFAITLDCRQLWNDSDGPSRGVER